MSCLARGMWVEISMWIPNPHMEQSCLARGMWVEINILHPFCVVKAVMPRKRHVSRNNAGGTPPQPTQVMPRKRHVSRNPSTEVHDNDFIVMPRKRHVSRNRDTAGFKPKDEMSCLARGMWVEIGKSKREGYVMTVMPRKRHVSRNPSITLHLHFHRVMPHKRHVSRNGQDGQPVIENNGHDS